MIAFLRLMAPAHTEVVTAITPISAAAVPETLQKMSDLAASDGNARQPLPAMFDLDDANNPVVAQVNGTRLSLAALTQATKVELAIGTLFSQPVVTDKARQLDQLINGELVLQAAHAATFELSAQEQVAALNVWLAHQGRDRPALVAALATVEMTLADFQAEFARLVIIDRFVSQQVGVTKLDRATLLRQWQAKAQISFGPAANGAINLPADPADPIVDSVAPIPAIQGVSNSLPIPVATVRAIRADTNALAPGLERIGPFTLWPAEQSNGVTKPTAIPPAALLAMPVTLPTIGLAPGNLAPTFTLPLLSSAQPAANLADWRGQPVVLSFWSTWCPYCRKQTPVLVDGAKSATAAIQFIGINVKEAATTVEPYVAEAQIPYPVLLDSAGVVAAHYLVRGYPTTYFLDGNGYVVAKHVGALDGAQLASYLSQLAAGARPIP